MYAIIAMGEEPHCIETPCMFFATKQDAEDHISKIPWLKRCGVSDEEDKTMYSIPETLYDEPIQFNLLMTLPQNVIEGFTKNSITYGKAVGLHFFNYYNDRYDSIFYYYLKKVQPGQALVGFGGESFSRRRI